MWNSHATWKQPRATVLWDFPANDRQQSLKAEMPLFPPQPSFSGWHHHGNSWPLKKAGTSSSSLQVTELLTSHRDSKLPSALADMARAKKKTKSEESEIGSKASYAAAQEAALLSSTATELLQAGAPHLNMSSQRSRAPRGGPRGGTHESGEEAQLWADIREQLERIKKHEDRAKDLNTQIFSMETRMKTHLDTGISEFRRRQFEFIMWSLS